MAKKYLRNTNGIVRAVTSDNLQLEKPLLNENYDIEVHNRNMDKIDSAIQEVKGKIDGLELVASNVKMADGSTVEEAVSANKTSILNNTSLANQALDKANEALQTGSNVKQNLVDKLTSEGLDVSTNNTFEELIGSIALGKRMISGITTPKQTNDTYYLRNGSVKTYAYVMSVKNLPFTPSCIVMTASGNYTYGQIPTGFYSEIIDKNSFIISSTNYGGADYNYSYNVLINDSSLNTVFKISDNSFTIPTYSSGEYHWVAFE